MVNKSGYSSIISSRARKEISESWNWDEERQQGPGDRFVKEVVYRIRQIEQYPERYSIRFKSYRETLVKRFP